MTTRNYRVETPEQLKALNAFCKDGWSVKNLATVWSVTRRRSGKSTMDAAIYVSFSGDTCGRTATVSRISGENELINEAVLHYNKALHYCQDNLLQI